MDAAGPIHWEDLGCAFKWDGGNQDNYLHLKNLPSNLQSPGEQSRMSLELLMSLGSEDPGLGRTHLMSNQGDRDNNLQGFSSKQGQRLSLTLGSRIASDMLNLSFQGKQKELHRHRMCSDYRIAREDARGLSSPRVKHIMDDSMCPEDETMSIRCPLNPSLCTHRDMPSLTVSLRNSKYLKPAQQLLDEFVCVSEAVECDPGRLFKRDSMRNGARALQLEQQLILQERNVICNKQCSSDEKYIIQIRINKLLALLDELDSRYEQYCHQIDGVISSFEVVSGTGSAKAYTALTIQAMSRHFSNLRGTIITQIHASREALSGDLNRKHGSFSQLCLSDQNTKQNRTLQNLAMIQVRQVWRPLRGLPENSVVILRAWLFEHFLHPYPNDNEKLMLASQTGLTRNQISNWFINARVRLWKPMIEEMYKEEFVGNSGDSNPYS